MKILALEFSTEHRSVAVSLNPTGAVKAVSERRDVGAMTLIHDALREAGTQPGDIDVIAIGLGPGSYTGVRSAIAIAQGWQLARDTRLLGISTVECLAEQAFQAGLRGRVQFAIDAQRGEFYLAGYELDGTGARLVEPLRIVGLDEVRARAAGSQALAGPEITRWFPAGTTLVPDAAVLAQLAVRRTDHVAGETLEPIYLRATSFVKAPPPRVIP